MNKLFLFLCLTLMSTLCFADTCPSAATIHHHLLKDWKAFDSEDGKELTGERLAEFKAHAKAFALAEWNKKKSMIHCYYRDENGSDLEAYLSKGKYVPANGHHYWYIVSGSLQCAAGADKCIFNQDSKHRQLAEKH